MEEFLNKFPLAKESISSLVELARNNPSSLEDVIKLSMCIAIRNYQIKEHDYKIGKELNLSPRNNSWIDDIGIPRG